MPSPRLLPLPRLVTSQTECPHELPSSPRSRKRTVSLSSLSSVQSRITLEFPKAQPALTIGHTRASSVYGSFTPIPSARTTLDQLNRGSSRPYSYFFKNLTQPHQKASRPWVEEDDSPLSSGSSSPILPSFSRTLSPPPILSPSLTSSEADHSQVEPRPGHVRTHNNELDPILAKLERRSKLLTKRVCCATCRKVGSDFPKCGRCDAMWCSRECRMFGGKRHKCMSRTY